jgi:hypothetical protein
MEAPDLEPIEFELANGHAMRVELSVFWYIPTRPEREEGALPQQYTAICIFTTEDTHPRRFELCDELRSSVTFHPGYEEKIWDWLETLVVERRHRSYDWAEDFVEDFEAAIANICTEGEDAVEHFAGLPNQDFQSPLEDDDFDPEDDSNFNDQNETTGQPSKVVRGTP